MLEQLLADIQQEFEIDADGKGYATIRGAARLANVSPSALVDSRSNHRGLLVRLKECSTEELSISLKPFAGFDYKLFDKLPDTVVVGIINYYALESKVANEQAKRVLATFSAIGFRSWLQQELGWQKPNSTASNNPEAQKLPLRHPEEAAKSVAASIQSIHQSVALIDPRLAQILIDHAMRGLDSQLLLPAQLKGDRLAGCVEIANDLGFYPTKEESSLGKSVAKAWRLDQHAEPQAVSRECGGAFREINAYPFNSVVVRATITNFYAAKGIAPRTANLKIV